MEKAFEIVVNKDNLPFDEMMQKAAPFMQTMMEQRAAFRREPDVMKLDATPWPPCELLTTPGLMDELCEKALDHVKKGEPISLQARRKHPIWRNCPGWDAYCTWDTVINSENKDGSLEWRHKRGWDEHVYRTRDAVYHAFVRTWCRMFPHEAIPMFDEYGENIVNDRYHEPFTPCPLYELAEHYMPLICAHVCAKGVTRETKLCLLSRNEPLLQDCAAWQESYIKYERKGIGRDWTQEDRHAARVDRRIRRKFVSYWNEFDSGNALTAYVYSYDEIRFCEK